jgi:threonine synthase
VILADSPLPNPLAYQIAAYGAIVGVLGSAAREHVLRALLAEGWHPATSSDPKLSGAGNPFGLEGYKGIAAEIVSQLGQMPDLVAVPAASGDLFVGVVRGFAELAKVAMPPPTIVACQPEGASALSASLSAGSQVTLAAPTSIARSTSDPTSGRLALRALNAESCELVTVSEDAIAASTRQLATAGQYVETSSALAHAGIVEAQRADSATADVAVAVLTAQGRGWNEDSPGLIAWEGELLSDGDGVLEAARASVGRSHPDTKRRRL